MNISSDFLSHEGSKVESQPLFYHSFSLTELQHLGLRQRRLGVRLV